MVARIDRTIETFLDEAGESMICFNLNGKALTDDDLAVVAALLHLHTLAISTTKITDDGLKHISG